MNIFNFLLGKKEKQTKFVENPVETDNILDLIKSISPFQCDWNHSKELQTFETKIEIIYKNLIILLLNWDFLEEIPYKRMLWELETLITWFDNENFNGNSDYIKSVKNPLQIMSFDIKSISRVQIWINNKRKKIYNLDKMPKYWWERENYMKLLSIIIDILLIESSIVWWNVPLMLIIAKLEETLKNIQFIDESFLFLKHLVLERIAFDLYKFSKVCWNDISYYIGETEQSDFWNITDNSCFYRLKATLNFLYHPESWWYSVQEDEEKRKLENSGFWNMLSFNKLVKYYKDRLESLDKLKEIIEKYAIMHNLEPSLNNEYYINYVYAKNNYLSLLIKKFEIGRYSNDEKKEIENQINDIFNDLTFHKKKTNFRNYFTYFKYAKYKYISSINYKRAENLWKARDEINQASRAIKDAIDIFENDDFYNYFEYDKESNIFNLSEDSENIDLIGKLYVCNLYTLPFNRQEKKKDLEELQKKIFKLEIDIITSEKFNLVDKKINDYKIDIMTVVWIFTAIVVYSFWTIQIFSIIENIWDALMFSWIFLSWILLLLFWVFLYKESKRKSIQLLVVSFIVLIISIFWRYYFKDYPININKWENTNSKLENSIYKATLLEESLEKLIEESKNNDANKSNS